MALRKAPFVATTCYLNEADFPATLQIAFHGILYDAHFSQYPLECIHDAIQELSPFHRWHGHTDMPAMISEFFDQPNFVTQAERF